MAQMFEDEKKYPDNNPRKNFVFLGYPYNPPLALDDYRAVTNELQQELPIRLWYFLDEVTTQEMMRKIWRAILRADLAVFDISGGNPNVALELGMAVAINRPCITLLKTGEPNPLGNADMGYSERAEYQSRATLKTKLKELLRAKSSALRLLNTISYRVQSDAFPYPREDIEQRLTQTVAYVFQNKRATRATVTNIFESNVTSGIVLDALRENDIFKLEGQTKGARWLLSDTWVHHDHEVVGA
jgi:hypothetical protein